MTSSDRIKKILKGEIPDRIPICDTSFWPKTIERWIKEGLPENIDIYDYFGIDRITFLSFKTGIFERELISETEDKVIFKDEFGKVNIDWKTESGNFGVPHVIDNFFKGKEDWYRIKNEIKPEEKRIPANISEIYNLARSKGDFIALTIEEPCWFIINRTYGFEKGLL
ncbi:MAG: hypothetical protein NZ891_04205, partial [bacterium]|nr:hypothetical protein [bacterium]MDW8163925.1 hypothetical protein [Candidatus Omnitrophota bacterium]